MKPIRIMLLVALALVALNAAAPAQAAKKMEVAVQDDGVFISDADIGREAALRAARAMGTTHLRMNVQWWRAVPESQRTQTTVPSPVVYDFSIWDVPIARASAYGIKSQLAFTNDPPAWACGNKKPPYECDGYKPSIRQWKGFVAAAARHFRGRVNRYTLWNEPNWFSHLNPHKNSPLLYRKLAQAGYRAIKRVDDNAEVVIGALAPHFHKVRSIPPLEFIRRMVCVNRKLERIRGANRKCGRKPLKLDAFATHPYDFEHKPTYRRENRDELTIANLGALPKLLVKLRKRGLLKMKRSFPIYLTEYGYMVVSPAVSPKFRTPESRRKKWLVQAWKIAQETPRIKQMFHYDFVSQRPGAPDGYFDMGLLKSDGAPRASYFALSNWIQAAVADGKVARPGPCSAC